MTTIVVDFIKKKLYTDSRVSWTTYGTPKWLQWLVLDISDDKFKYNDHQQKYWRCNRLGNDVIITGTGSLSEIREFVKRVEAGSKKPQSVLKSSEVMVIYTTPKLCVHSYTNNKDKPKVCYATNTGRLIAGSGSETFKLMADHTNFTTEEIFDIVKKEDRATGGKVVEVDLSGRQFNEDVF